MCHTHAINTVWAFRLVGFQVFVYILFLSFCLGFRFVILGPWICCIGFLLFGLHPFIIIIKSRWKRKKIKDTILLESTICFTLFVSEISIFLKKKLFLKYTLFITSK